MTPKFIRFFYITILLLFSYTSHATLPEGFVYIRDIDPSIIESPRYYSSQNFLGKRMIGYEKSTLILTKPAAQALSQVQQALLKDGYSLVIYDAYRPQKTVNEFVRWSHDYSDQKMKNLYYPRIDKRDAFKLNYISDKSGHTRGSAVDLTIIALNSKIKAANEIVFSKRVFKNNVTLPFLDDGTIDMGTSYDLFDIASHHQNPLIEGMYLKNRQYLRQMMLKHGFIEYPEEWWHYMLKNEPFPNTYFDFDIN